MSKWEDKLVTTLTRMKNEYEDAIIAGGRKQATALIRSKRLIGHLHEHIKRELVSQGIHPSRIHPHLGMSKPELRMAGYLKYKDQDICVLPKPPGNEIIRRGVLTGQMDGVGKAVMDESISINVRSQLSSLAKNFDTLFERTFAEPLNLHLRSPRLTMGEVYLVPSVAYDPDEMIRKKVAWKEVLPLKYIPAFQKLNNRKSESNAEYKYERVSLLIVDFRKSPPEVVDSHEPLIDDGLIDSEYADEFSLSGLSIHDFVPDILSVYKKRHGSLDALKEGAF